MKRPVFSNLEVHNFPNVVTVPRYRLVLLGDPGACSSLGRKEINRANTCELSTLQSVAE